jgi:hypothetical protein
MIVTPTPAATTSAAATPAATAATSARETSSSSIRRIGGGGDGALIDINDKSYFELPIVRQCLREIRNPSTTPASILSVTIDGRVVTSGEYAIRYLVNMRHKRARKNGK